MEQNFRSTRISN